MMGAALAAGPVGQPSALHSALFTAPGRPRPLARRLAIHNRVMSTLRSFFASQGMHEIPVTALADHTPRAQLEGMLQNGFSSVWCESEVLPRDDGHAFRHLRGLKLMEAAGRDLSLDGLGDLQENLLKTVARSLGADLLGGRHVTRLDRMLGVSHPRLTYRKALGILENRGCSLAFGEVLHPEAEATLTRFCGNQPFMITRLPAQQNFDRMRPCQDDPAVTESVEYILPYAGITMEGGVRRGSPEYAGFSLGLGRLLQYLMGLESVMDTLIDPADRIARMMNPAVNPAATPASSGTGPRQAGGAC